MASPRSTTKSPKLHSLKKQGASGWHQQLELATRALQDPDWYRREVAKFAKIDGISDEDVDTTSRGLRRLRERGALEPPAFGKDPVQVIRHPAGYNAHSDRLVRLRALRLHGLDLARIFTIHVADFPLLVLDPIAAQAYNTLVANVGRENLVLEVIRLRAGYESSGKIDRTQAMRDHRFGLKEILQDTPNVVHESAALTWALERRVHPQALQLRMGTWTCYPMIPGDLILEGLQVSRASFLCA